MKRQESIQGQSLVEFALIAGILLLFMFIIVESGRIFWAWTTVQNAAREGARYAVTGRKMPGAVCPVAHLSKFTGTAPNDACEGVDDFRPASVISTTHNALTGLKLDEESRTATPNFYDIRVRGIDKNDVPRGSYLAAPNGPEPHAGDPNKTVTVEVRYRVPIITPLFSDIVESILLRGVVTLNNEAFGQLGNANQGVGVPPPSAPVSDLEPPLAVDDQYSTAFETPLTITAVGVLENDTLRAGIIVSPKTTTTNGGSVIWELDGSGIPTGGFTYTPPAGFDAADTFTYVLANGVGESDPATVTIFVNPPPPELQPDTYEIFANQILFVPSTDNPSLIANDTLNGGAIDIPSAPGIITAEGVVIDDLALDGSFSYEPPIKDNAVAYSDTFEYSVTNLPNTATPQTAKTLVTIIVQPPPPVADNDIYQTFINTPLVAPDVANNVPNILANDELYSSAAVLPLSNVTTSQGGTVTVNPDGSFVYTPPTDYISVNNIADTFIYQVQDSFGRLDDATVSIYVLPAVPFAKDDSFYETDMDETLVVSLEDSILKNDTLNGATILNTGQRTTTQGGSVNLRADGTFTYVPKTGFFSGPIDTFAYTLQNTEGSSTATVSIEVNPPFPLAVEDYYETEVDRLLRVAAGPGLLFNDVRNGGTITGFDSRSAQGGVVMVNADGSFDYQPPSGFESGPLDTFEYVLSNSSGSSRATVKIFVGEVLPNRDLSGIARVAAPIPAAQPGVVVVLFDAAGTQVATATTDVVGFYHFANLLPGTYTLTACHRVGGADYSAVLTTTAPTAYADLFLMPGVCTGP